MYLRISYLLLFAVFTFPFSEQHHAQAENESAQNLTDGTLAVQNLDGQIATLEKLLDSFPERQDFRAALFDLVATRTQLTGSYTEFAKLRRLAEETTPDQGGLLLQARYLTAIHEFRAAERIVDALILAEPDRIDLRSQQRRIKLALREGVASLRAEQLETLVERRGYEELLLMAEIEAELGNFDSSDQYFAEALNEFRDSSPFQPAFLEFRRGLMWGEKAGDDARALEHYNAAVRYLPQYVNAQVHRAELVSAGDPQDAIQSLRSVVSSDDPEPRGLLGELLQQAGNAAEAQTHIVSAAESYQQLLEEYPLAFADHAAEFFTGPGEDPARGLALAKSNLENRRTERAFVVALEAAAAAAQQIEECTLALEAKALRPVFKPLLELLQATSQRCPL